DGVFEFRQPSGKACDYRVLELAQRRRPFVGVGVVEFGELGGELQQPRESVRALEGAASIAVEVFHFLRDVGGRQALRERAPRIGGGGRLWGGAHAARGQPGGVHRGGAYVAAGGERCAGAAR